MACSGSNSAPRLNMRNDTSDKILGDRVGPYKSPQKQHVMGPLLIKCVQIVSIWWLKITLQDLKKTQFL